MLATNEVIMPVLGMNQDSGKVVRWLATEGQSVQQGEPLLEVETDKAIAEIEAPASGVLSMVSAREGDDVPVGRVIAVILPVGQIDSPVSVKKKPVVTASPLAARMAAEHQLKLEMIRPEGGRVEKNDVLAYLKTHEQASGIPLAVNPQPRRVPASPKARRLALEKGIDLSLVQGSGPEGAVLAGDLLDSQTVSSLQAAVSNASLVSHPKRIETQLAGSRMWEIMADRMTATWTSTPHFFLLREVVATRFVTWKEIANKKSSSKITFTDLLVKLVATCLRKHPRINAHYYDGKIQLVSDVNIGIAVAAEDGLVVPVIRKADELNISEIAAQRLELVAKARAGRLHLDDIVDGTFTISNLGMYGVDAFLAILNPPQAAILATGRIAERVVPIQGEIAIRPMLSMSLSLDHRVVDGARGAQFLETLVDLIEEPLGLISE